MPERRGRAINSLELRKILLSYHNEFEIITHDQPLCSAQEGAAYFKINIAQTAPTLILAGDGEYFAVIISGARKRLDMKKMAKVLCCHKVEMAEHTKIKEITGHDAGSIPLIGLSLPYIMDEQLFAYDFIYGGAGEADKTLKIAPTILAEVNKVVTKFI